MDSKKKFVIGIDFGTLSVRSAIYDITNGEEVSSSVYEYENGVIDQCLPGTDIEVPTDGALQDPRDYERGLVKTVKEAVKESGLDSSEIAGIGTDFTCCTILPAKKDSKPLCVLDNFKHNVHSWVKLWKDHSSREYAYKIIEHGKKRNESFLTRSGGKITSEFLFPKTMMILDNAQEVYHNADYILEAGDWIVWRMTGKLTRNMAALSTRANYCDGFPPIDFFTELDPRLKDVYSKLEGERLHVDQVAGCLSEEYQDKLSLPGIPVAAGNVDACVSVPACGVYDASKLILIMGTSTCFMTIVEEYIESYGIEQVKDGIIPGFWGYITGQSSVGDLFDWFVKNCVPGSYYREAEKRDISIHSYLVSLVECQKPGSSGLLALDWLNGNRLEILDSDLSALIMGMNMQTRPEEIYRALIEATAFGAKNIINTFEKNGVMIKEIYAAGGIPNKNKMAMQIYADIINRKIKLSKTTQPGALGSAIFASVASGLHENIKAATQSMAHLKDTRYEPNPEHAGVYGRMFEEYMKIYKYFGTSPQSVMKKIKDLKIEQASSK